MGFNVGEKITAADFENIKSRVYNECSRRSIGYNYSTAVSGQMATATQGASIINTLNQINSNVVSRNNISSGSILQNWGTIYSAINYFESCPKEGTNSGCRSGCKGLCQAACGGSCTGCSGSCSSACSDDCISSCVYTCYGGCSLLCGLQCGGCGGCSNTCSGSCTSGCSGCWMGCG